MTGIETHECAINIPFPRPQQVWPTKLGPKLSFCGVMELTKSLWCLTESVFFLGCLGLINIFSCDGAVQHQDRLKGKLHEADEGVER